MRRLRSSVAVFFLLAISASMPAQNEIDIMRYSYQESLGSTRTMAMGGAFGALGADLACLS